MPNYEFDDDTGSINSDWLNPVGNWTYGPATKTIAKTLTPEDGVKIYPQGSDGGPFIGGTNVAGYYDDDSVLGYGSKFKPTGGDGTVGWERPPGPFNTTWYGADKTGVVSWTASLDEALAAIKANGGGTLIADPGTYRQDTASLFANATAHVIFKGYGAIIDSRVAELSAGHGRPTIGVQMSAQDASFIMEGFHFKGDNIGTNGDAVWANPKASLFLLRECSIDGGFRHAFVNVDPYGSTNEQMQHGFLHNLNVFECTDSPIIISDADSPTVNECRIKDNPGGNAIEIGQAGDRSFLGAALNGTVTGYSINNNVIETNANGVLVIDGRGGEIDSDFEANNSQAAGGEFHIDFTGGSSSGGGDLAGYAEGSSFSGTHGNIKTRAGSRLGGNFHKSGNPAIEHTDDLEPLYAPFEYFQSGVTTRYAATNGKGGVIDSLNTTSLRVHESVAENSTGVQVSPVFTLDGTSLQVIRQGIVHTVSQTNINLQFYLRNVTDGTVVTTLGTAGLSIEQPTQQASNSSIRQISLLSSDNDAGYTAGDLYAIYVRNKTGSALGTVTLHALIDFNLLEHAPV